jgi:hypothetical protein
MRGIIEARKRQAALLVALLAMGASGCASAGLKPPEQLSKIGDASFYNLQLAKEVDRIAHFVADAEAQQLIPAADAQKVMDVLKVVNKGQKDLEAVFGAGQVEGDAKTKAVAAIREGLQKIPNYLSGNAKTIAQGYVTSALILLTWFS